MKNTLFIFSLLLMSTQAFAHGGAGSSGGGGNGGNDGGITVTPYFTVYIAKCPDGRTIVLQRTDTNLFSETDLPAAKNRAVEICSGM